MIGIDKKSRVIFQSSAQEFLDTNLAATKPTKSDTIIACIDSSSLIRHQIHIQKNSLPHANTQLNDWLYAQCIQEGVFKSDSKYSLLALSEDTPSEQVFQIYALELSKDKSHQIFIPDILLPLVLQPSARQSNVFLFGNSLVFYYQNKLVYHTICQDCDCISKALEYIHTIYSITPSVIYSSYQDHLHPTIEASPLETLTNNSAFPIANLSFLYFSKAQTNPLPLLIPQIPFSISKSNSFNLLVKTACITALMLLYPMGDFIYSLYLKNQFNTLTEKNLAILQKITSLKQSLLLGEKQKSPNTLQANYQSLYEIQNSYNARYYLISDFAQIIQKQNILIEDFYLTSDVSQDILAISLKVSSPSHKNIIDFINKLNKNPILQQHNQEIFNEKIQKNQEKSSAEIIWTSNAI